MPSARPAAPRRASPPSIAELKKRKIAVIADGESRAALVRNILELSDTPEATARKIAHDEIKSFIERYSDLMYLALAALSIISTIFAAIYTKATRIAPDEKVVVLNIAQARKFRPRSSRSGPVRGFRRSCA